MSHPRKPVPASSQRADQIGAWTSALCLIHCAIPPFFFAASSAWQTPPGWEFFDLAFLIVSFLAVWFANKNVVSKRMRVLLWIGWVVLAAGIGAEQGGWHPGKILLYVGSAILVLGHLWNLRTNKKSCPVKMVGPDVQSKRA